MLKDYSSQFRDVSTLGFDYCPDNYPLSTVEIIHLSLSLSLSLVVRSARTPSFNGLKSSPLLTMREALLRVCNLILIIVAHLRRVETAFSRFSLGINSTSRISLDRRSSGSSLNRVVCIYIYIYARWQHTYARCSPGFICRS